MRFPRHAVIVALVVALWPAGTAAAEQMSSYVVEIDAGTRCLAVAWHNDSRKKVCWSDVTTFSELESGEARSASDVRVGSYLYIEGEERDDGALAATAIQIWEAAPPPPEAE